MTMKDSELAGLLPCPFCGPVSGNAPRVVSRRAPKLGPDRYHYSVKHPMCGAESGHALTADVAIAKWNRRAIIASSTKNP